MTIALEKPTFAPRPKRWTKREYISIVETGAFRGQHVYLFRGELIEMAPMGSAHARCVNLVNMWATRNFSFACCQSPFETPGESIPEPDCAVVTAAQFDRKPYPNEAALIIEVSDSSLKLDREKALDYAAAGAPEYWILDIANSQLIVHRAPIIDASAPLGFRYASVQTLAADAKLSPIAKPSLTVSAAEFLVGI